MASGCTGSGGGPRNLLAELGAVAIASPRVGPRDAVSAKQQPSLDDDLQLARILQEQERIAFHLAQGYGAEGHYENEQEPEGQVEQLQQAEEVEEELDDEELARRLQAEMDMQAYRALYAAQGIDLDNLEQGVDGADVDSLGYHELTTLGEMAGTVSKGLPAEVVARLPVLSYAQLQEQQGEGVSNERCCICLSDFETADEVMPLACKHAYHAACLKQWLDVNKVCPVCNREVPQRT